ncbi:hypothetical protein [Miltoncostaea oceani]|uniref:hypothetical protein n=1 Tax=Miltoncostaea oceani TaxID=2843216 RepID=UPI001C3DD217|nr:hypothetical protein [Miltoncostaea oceani]
MPFEPIAHEWAATPVLEGLHPLCIGSLTMTDPEFYDPGQIIALRLRGETARVLRDGLGALANRADGRLLECAADFRQAFPDGKLRRGWDGWPDLELGWFSAHGPGLDAVFQDIRDAVAAAVASLSPRFIREEPEPFTRRPGESPFISRR